jgi:hypothetical protein
VQYINGFSFVLLNTSEQFSEKRKEWIVVWMTGLMLKGKMERVLWVRPAPQTLYLGNSALSKTRVLIPYLRSSYAAKLPAGPAPEMMTEASVFIDIS